VDSVTDSKRSHDCPICGETLPLPADVFAALAETPKRLAEALRAAGDREPEGWAPTFVAVHMAGLEVSRGWRFRQILAEDDPLLDALDQDEWTRRLHYGERDLELALETFATNRAANLELLRLAGEAGLARPYHHAIFGQMTLGMLVDHTYDHDQAHLRQIVGRVATFWAQDHS
jgi:hypothetical protein